MAEVLQSVQELSIADVVPQDFVHLEHDQPGGTMSQECSKGKHIPVIDMSKLDRGAGMVDAAMEWGCFQVINHGVPEELVAELQRVGRAFFELPEEEKVPYTAPAGSIQGYKTGTMARPYLAGKKLWGDFLYHYAAPPAIVNHQIWPKNPARYRQANEAYCQHVQRLTRDIFEHLSRGLGLEKGTMREAFGGDQLVLLQKVNYYPPCPRQDLVFGNTPHTDMCIITILVPDEIPGLQIVKDGSWHNVKLVPQALVVLIGDQTKIFSNERYKAVTHRAMVNKEKTRMSWPVFVEPPGELVVAPYHQLSSDSNPAKYKAVKYKDYQYCKMNIPPK